MYRWLNIRRIKNSRQFSLAKVCLYARFSLEVRNINRSYVRSVQKIDIFSEGCLIYSRYTNLIISRNISNEILRIKFHILIHRRISSIILIRDQLRTYSINTWQHYCRGILYTRSAILHTRVHIENIIKFNLTSLNIMLLNNYKSENKNIA